MIHVKEIFSGKNSVEILMGGVLDRESIDLLERLFLTHRNAGRIVSLNLEDLWHLSREGLAFLHENRNKVILVNVPEYLKTEKDIA